MTNKVKVTADTITDEQIRMLAKVRCAEHISQRIRGPIPRAVSALAYGHNKPTTLRKLQDAGLVAWDNGSVLTVHGTELLARCAEIWNARHGNDND